MSTYRDSTWAVSEIGSPRPSWMSREERKSACPPSWVIPTSKLTRVRVDDFSKIIARLLPASDEANRCGSRLRSAVSEKIAATSAALRSWMVRKWRKRWTLRCPVARRSWWRLPSAALPLERHRHAARAAARAGQLATGKGDHRRPAPQVSRSQGLGLGEHAPASRGEAVGRVAVLVVEEDD